MAVDGIDPGRRGKRTKGEKSAVSTAFSLSVENEEANAGRDDRTDLTSPNSQARTGTGQGSFLSCSAELKQDWQLYLVEPHSVK